MWLYDSVPETLISLYKDGYAIYIISNQTKEWKLEMIKESMNELNIPIKVIIGFGNGIKKPDKELFDIKFNKKTSFYTGDWSDSDMVFAKNTISE